MTINSGQSGQSRRLSPGRRLAAGHAAAGAAVEVEEEEEEVLVQRASGRHGILLRETGTCRELKQKPDRESNHWLSQMGRQLLIPAPVGKERNAVPRGRHGRADNRRDVSGRLAHPC